MSTCVTLNGSKEHSLSYLLKVYDKILMLCSVVTNAPIFYRLSLQYKLGHGRSQVFEIDVFTSGHLHHNSCRFSGQPPTTMSVFLYVPFSSIHFPFSVAQLAQAIWVWGPPNPRIILTPGLWGENWVSWGDIGKEACGVPFALRKFWGIFSNRSG